MLRFWSLGFRVEGVPNGSALCERALVCGLAHPKTANSGFSGVSRWLAAMYPKASRAEDPGAALATEEHLAGTVAPGDVQEERIIDQDGHGARRPICTLARKTARKKQHDLPG